MDVVTVLPDNICLPSDAHRPPPPKLVCRRPGDSAQAQASEKPSNAATAAALIAAAKKPQKPQIAQEAQHHDNDTPQTTKEPQQALQTPRRRPPEPPNFMWTTLCQYQPSPPKKRPSHHRAPPSLRTHASNEASKAAETPAEPLSAEGPSKSAPVAGLESLGQLLGQLDVMPHRPNVPSSPRRKSPRKASTYKPPPLGRPKDGRLRSASDEPNLLAKPSPGEYMLLSRRGGIRCIVVVWD